MREAFDAACAELGLSEAAHENRQRVASAIVEAATNGERDPAVLKSSATAIAVSITASSVAVAGDKGKGLGQDIVPGQSANPGQQTAPGQLGVKPSHPDNFGATASSICAHNTNPQGKDDCVRLNK